METLKIESTITSENEIDLERYLLEKFATDINIPSGILHRFVAHSSRIREFDGNNESPVCTQGEWENIYDELVFNHHHGYELTPLDIIKKRASEYIQNGMTPIFIANFNYEIVRARFWNVLQRYLDEAKFDGMLPFENLQIDDIFENRNSFFATTQVITKYGFLTTLPRVHRGLEVTFILPTDGYLSNYSQEIGNIEIDFGQGLGYQKIKINESLIIKYDKPGEKIISLRCSNSSGVKYSRFNIEIELPTAPPFDVEMKLIGDQYDLGGNNYIIPEGHCWLYLGYDENGNKKNKLTHPVIVSEGFPGNYELDYLWDRLNQENLANKLLHKGHDLIILGYKDGTLPIQANANVVIKCIKTAIQFRTGTAPLQVGGASMGGLITRYALTLMENKKINHETSRFFTIDTPHFGANISPSVQAFVQYFSVYIDSAKVFAKQLASVAAQQMLLFWIKPYDQWSSLYMGGVSPERQSFILDLNYIGNMPKNLTSLAVSDGKGSGGLNEDTPGTLAVKFDVTACIYDESYVFPNAGTDVLFSQMRCSKVDNSKWSFKVSNGGGYDSAQGGQTESFKSLSDEANKYSPELYFPKSCFIPTVSGCGIGGDLFTPVTSGSKSIFNYYKYSADNLMHIVLSPELALYLENFIDGGSPIEK